MDIIINGLPLDEDAIAREMQYHPAENLETARAEAAKALVIRTLLIQQARTDGFRQEDDDAIEALLEKNIAVDEPDKDRCMAAYENHRERYRAPDLFEASHILLPAQPDDQEQLEKAKSQANDCLKTLQEKPAQFAKLAGEHSACSSAENGGSLGQFSTGDTVDEFETFLYNLEPGQLCPVAVQTRFGFHVLRLDYREYGRELPFESALESVRDDLLSQDWRAEAAGYVKKLVEKANILGIDMA
ncbi:MAG: peptidylprolyl isomerase [Magnetovibrio sp.]|nr:peptidylprolyl isomerase [Magnetovibrio sp.]